MKIFSKDDDFLNARPGRILGTTVNTGIEAEYGNRLLYKSNFYCFFSTALITHLFSVL